MTTETTMTEQGAIPTEAPAASQPADQAPATVAAPDGQQQPATTPEVKPEGEQEQPQGAPEAYEFKAPEGQAFSPEVLGAFSEVAKELNLPQEAAQKVIDKIAPALAARQEAALSNARAQWVADVKADTELGGTAVAEKIALANKAFADFGTPELRTLLDTTGLGDHPEMLRWAHRVGKAISEDGFMAGRGASAAHVDPAKRLFPNQA